MDEPEPRGVERGPPRPFVARPVEAVAEDRPAGGAELHADLVAPPGDEARPHAGPRGGGARLRLDLVLQPRVLALLAGPGDVDPPRLLVFGQHVGQLAAGRGGDPLRPGDVLPQRRAGEELRPQLLGDPLGAGEEDQPRRRAVDPVDNPEPFADPVPGGGHRAEQPGDERRVLGGFVGGRNRHDSRLLVGDDDPLVDVHDAEPRPLERPLRTRRAFGGQRNLGASARTGGDVERGDPVHEGASGEDEFLRLAVRAAQSAAEQDGDGGGGSFGNDERGQEASLEIWKIVPGAGDRRAPAGGAGIRLQCRKKAPEGAGPIEWRAGP